MPNFEKQPQFTPKQEQNSVEHNTGSVSVETLTEELEKLRAQEKISEVEIPTLFEKINRKILTQVGEQPEDELLRQLAERKVEIFRSILERMQATCGDRGNFEALEGAAKIMTTEGRHVFGEDINRPYFDVRTQKIYMGPEATRILANPDILIALLAAKGSSGAANDLHHEFIHSHQVRKTQTSKEKLVEALNIFGDKNILLKEAHALIGADRKGNGKRIEIGNLHEELSSDFYGLISTEEDVRRLKNAALRIKQLYALGFSDESIGELVSRTKWDKKSETYDTLTSEVERVMRDRNLSENEIASLVKVDELKTRLRIEKTRIAAKEVVEGFLK
ncbi:MAG: hypothetical protein ABII94_00425 [Patescibacteria group bacterium]